MRKISFNSFFANPFGVDIEISIDLYGATFIYCKYGKTNKKTEKNTRLY